MKRKSSSKSVSKDKKTPLPSIDLDQTVVSVKTGTINHHLFFPPKDYTIQDGDRALSSMKQMRDSMDKFSAKAVRPTLPPEALQKLRQMRNSGKLTREQQKQIDLILE